MPKQPKPTQPKVDLREDELKEIKVSIRTSIHDSINEYIAFHEESMGPPKANESKVIDRGMEEFFKSDEAFQAFRRKKVKNNKQGRQPVAVGEGKKGGPGNANRDRETSV